MRSRNRYHPIVPFAFSCINPIEACSSVPRSTQHYWKQRNKKALFNAGLIDQHELFATLKAVAHNRHLLACNRAVLRCIAISRFVQTHVHEIKRKAQNAIQVVLHNISKAASITGHATALKFSGISYRHWLSWKNTASCQLSPINRCRRKHPGQLLISETNALVRICNNPAYYAWPLASVYHMALRTKQLACSLACFYKYAALLVTRQSLPVSRRKNHQQGIRAQKPFQIIHTDITHYQTDDQQRAFIYLVQDNYSRAVLCHTVQTERKASHTIELIRTAMDMRVTGETLWLVTDGGAENKPIEQTFAEQPLLHLVAQKDISFSNSMIEYLNRTLKYRYLYRKQINTIGDLRTEVQLAITDYNNRPAHALNGLTPLEALSNQQPNLQIRTQMIQEAAKQRIQYNKTDNCCYTNK
jgi:putative transposase